MRPAEAARATGSAVVRSRTTPFPPNATFETLLLPKGQRRTPPWTQRIEELPGFAFLLIVSCVLLQLRGIDLHAKARPIGDLEAPAVIRKWPRNDVVRLMMIMGIGRIDHVGCRCR